MGMRLISLPIESTRTQDADGFVSETPEYLEHIRATTRSATAEDVTAASAGGYTITRVYQTSIHNYAGQSYLIDENEGQIYDIKRTSENGRWINLYGEMRKNGKIRDASRNG